MNSIELMRDAAVLARHYVESRGVTYGTPDRCSCGVETVPVSGDEDILERRMRSFAGHQAEMLAAVRESVN